MSDCDQFAFGTRQRQICEGESELPLKSVNAFRAEFGIAPLQGVEDSTESNNELVIPKVVKNNVITRVAGGCCGGGNPVVIVPKKQVVEGTGVGGRLLEIFTKHGFKKCDDCYALANRMNEWGQSGCREKLDLIVADILPRALAWEKQKLGWISSLLPEAVTSVGIRKVVEQAIETAVPVQYVEEASPPKTTPKKKRVNVRDYVTRSVAITPPILLDTPIDKTKVTSHMLYHVMPLSGEAEWVWQRQMQWLREVRSEFSGRLIVGIVTPAPGDVGTFAPPEAVKAALQGIDAEFIIEENHKALGEGKTFTKMLEMIKTDDPNSVFVYGHSKGVTNLGYNRTRGKSTDVSDPVHRWAEAMFDTTFRNLPQVVDALSRRSLAGSFRMRGGYKPGLPGVGSYWFYSGTFFGGRCAAVFNKEHWKHIPSHYGCVEQWPRCHFECNNHTECLFWDNTQNLYDRGYWDQQVWPAFLEWKKVKNSN